MMRVYMRGGILPADSRAAPALLFLKSPAADADWPTGAGADWPTGAALGGGARAALSAPGRPGAWRTCSLPGGGPALRAGDAEAGAGRRLVPGWGRREAAPAAGAEPSPIRVPRLQ